MTTRRTPNLRPASHPTSETPEIPGLKKKGRRWEISEKRLDALHDRARDDVLAQFGFLVLRVTNADVMSNVEGVLDAVHAAAIGRTARYSPHPNPSPEGEGLYEVLNNSENVRKVNI